MQLLMGSGGARKRVLAAATLAVAAGVVAAIVATHGTGHDPRRSHRVAAGAATVERRDLITSEDETGTISYAASSTIVNRLQGTLTWVPAVGHVIAPGQKLFDVDNFPVILMNGTTPAYRTLGPSDSPGPDIAQLNANLIKLGFDPYGIMMDDEWQPATTAGVEAFQEANDEPQTSSLTLGTIVFLRGAQRVSGLQGAATAVADEAPGDHGDEFVGYTPTASTTTTTTTATATAPPPCARPGGGQSRTRSAIAKLGSEIGHLEHENQQLQREIAAARSHSSSRRSSRRSSSSGAADSGPVSGGSSPVMTATSTNLVVTTNVPAGQQDLTRVGAQVPVVMPSGVTIRGHVTAIGQASSTGGSSQVPITIHLDKHQNGRSLDQATVSVRFVEKTARHVLSVPVTALLARPGGGYAVQEAKAPYQQIDVKIGTFATGYVQISGAGLRPGLKITDSQG